MLLYVIELAIWVIFFFLRERLLNRGNEVPKILGSRYVCPNQIAAHLAQGIVHRAEQAMLIKFEFRVSYGAVLKPGALEKTRWASPVASAVSSKSVFGCRKLKKLAVKGAQKKT